MNAARKASTVLLLLALACATLVAPASADGRRATAPSPASSNPATWQPWMLSSADQFRLPAPPADDSDQTLAELSELRRLQRTRTPAQEKAVRFWNVGAPTLRWTQEMLDMIVLHRPSPFPTRTARMLADLHIAMYDAMVAAFDSRAAYDRSRPATLDPRIHPMLPAKGSSYPDVRAAIAGAAESMLAYLFPEHDPADFTAIADQATESRLWGGMNFRSDVDAGRELGHQVAGVVIQWAMVDGTQNPWDFADQRLCSTTDCQGSDEQYWVPTPLVYQYPPTDPMASKWVTLLMATPDELLPPPPPAYGSDKFFKNVAAVKEANDDSSPEDLQLAYYWDDGPGSYSPAGHWNEIAMELARNRGLGMAETARLFALMDVAIRESFIATWNAKYTYWNIRPVTVIRERPTINGVTNPYYDPTWLPNLITPPFPSYTSGHAGESGAAARVLQYFFPDSATSTLDISDHGPQGSIDEIAQQVARSRLIGGIHYPVDNRVALHLGREIARLAILHAESDGGPLP